MRAGQNCADRTCADSRQQMAQHQHLHTSTFVLLKLSTWSRRRDGMRRNLRVTLVIWLLIITPCPLRLRRSRLRLIYGM